VLVLVLLVVLHFIFLFFFSCSFRMRGKKRGGRLWILAFIARSDAPSHARIATPLQSPRGPRAFEEGGGDPILSRAELPHRPRRTCRLQPLAQLISCAPVPVAVDSTPPSHGERGVRCGAVVPASNSSLSPFSPSPARVLARLSAFACSLRPPSPPLPSCEQAVSWPGIGQCRFSDPTCAALSY
jgi:hypothetical protein